MSIGGCADPQGCEDADKHVYEYQHRELTEEDRRRIEAHLQACEHCLGLYHEEDVIRRRVSQCACEAAPEQLRSRVFAMIAGWRTGR